MITALEPRMIAFSFSAHEFSLAVSYFVLALNRLTGLCHNYADSRLLTKRYRGTQTTYESSSDFEGSMNSEVLVQEFFDMEESSSYTVTFSARFILFETETDRNTTMQFYTPPAGN